MYLDLESRTVNKLVTSSRVSKAIIYYYTLHHNNRKQNTIDNIFHTLL